MNGAPFQRPGLPHEVPGAFEASAPHDVRRFLSLLWQGRGVREIRIPKHNQYGQTASGYFDDPDAAVVAAEAWDGRANVYITLNQVNPALLSRAVNRIDPRASTATSDDDVVEREWLFIDIDAARPSGISSTDEELAAAKRLLVELTAFLAAAGWPEPVTCMSGNGSYALYRIALANDPAATALVKQVLESLAERFNTEAAHVDTSVSNVARIIALVGTMKMKGDSSEDRPHRRSYVVSAPDQLAVVSRAQLEQLCVSKEADTLNAGSSSRTPRSGALTDTLERAGIEYREQPPDASGVIWYHVRQCPLHDDGRPFECGVGQTLPDGPYAGHCFHPEGEGKGWHEFKRALGLDGGSRHDPVIVSGTALPQISVTGRHMRDKSEAGWRALLADNDPPRFFRHGAYIAEIQRNDGARPRIAHLNLAGLRGRLDRCANWVRVGSGGPQPVNPPKEVVEDMLELPKPLPSLLGIVGIPTFAQDGALDTTPGYQPSTRLYYEPAGEPVPAVPASPDATDLKRAKQIIGQEWLADFPFVDDASRANAIAAPLTAVARELIDGPTPMFAIDAPAQGTGKSLLANGIGTIIIGAQPAVTTETRNEEELRKRITALLRGGVPVVLLDNITKRMESGTLCSLLTAPLWSDRLLSKNEQVDVPVRAVWLATGNNLELSGEMTRRVVWIRLDSRRDRPWERSQFRHAQLNAWVARHRHELVWAFLVLVQHWTAQGRPDWRGRVLGSFESWSLVIGGVLEAAGIAGFMENREQLYRRMDSETEEWRAFVGAWWDEHGTQTVKASALHAFATELAPAIFVRARDGATEQMLKATLGRAIAARRDRRFGDLFIRSAQDDSHAKVAMWRLEPVGAEPEFAGVEDEMSATPAQPSQDNESTSASFAGDAGDCGGSFKVATEVAMDGDVHAVRETIVNLPPQTPQPPQTDSEMAPNDAGVVRGIDSHAAEPPQIQQEPCRGGCGLMVPAGRKCTDCAARAVAQWRQTR